MSTPTSANERFDAEAAAWDSNPDVHRASKAALGSLLQHFPRFQEYRDSDDKSNGLNVLELGCGTGLLSLPLSPYVASLTALDTSEGMIAALTHKLATTHSSVTNIHPICLLLTDPDDPQLQDPPTTSAGLSRSRPPGPKRFDLAISHLVLHHIPELAPVMKTLYGVLKPGGWVGLTDFENFGPEARKFHPEAKMAGVERHGVGRSEMETLLKEAGFVDVKVETAFVMEKDVEPEGSMEFPFLICMGRKPD